MSHFAITIYYVDGTNKTVSPLKNINLSQVSVSKAVSYPCTSEDVSDRLVEFIDQDNFNHFLEVNKFPKDRLSERTFIWNSLCEMVAAYSPRKYYQDTSDIILFNSEEVEVDTISVPYIKSFAVSIFE